jgi:lipoprotein-releasing system permease protein
MSVLRFSPIRLETYVARRYLASSSGGMLFSLITWIALGGVTVGVAALIVVIGVMSGMQRDLLDKILDSSPHVLVLQDGSALRMDNWERVTGDIKTVDGVVGVSPFVLSQVSVLRGAYSQPADMYGVAPSMEGDPVTEMEARIRDGIHDLGPTESGLPAVLMGSRLAARMQLLRGDTVTLIAFENISIGPMGIPSPSMRQYQVSGTFTTGMYDYDTKNIYVTLSASQEQLGIKGKNQVSGLSVSTIDPDEAGVIAGRIQSELGNEFSAISWSATNAALFSALKLEKLAMGLILFLIVVVAAFNIVSTLVMVVVDKTREIGILKAMGVSNQTIMRIFMLQGVGIGILGTIFGLILGVATSLMLNRYEIIKIPAEVYFVDKLPLALNMIDVGTIVIGSIVVSFLATVFPAVRASQLEPVEAIRHE